MVGSCYDYSLTLWDDMTSQDYLFMKGVNYMKHEMGSVCFITNWWLWSPWPSVADPPLLFGPWNRLEYFYNSLSKIQFGQQDNSSRRLNAYGNVFTHLAISALWLATFLSSSCFLDNHRFKWFASFEERYIYIRLHQNIILSKLYSCINTHKYILLQIWSVIWSKLYLLQVNHI